MEKITNIVTIKLIVYTISMLCFAILTMAYFLPTPSGMGSKWEWLLDPFIYPLIFLWPIYFLHGFGVGYGIAATLTIIVMYKGLEWLWAHLSSKKGFMSVIFLWIFVGTIISWMNFVASI